MAITQRLELRQGQALGMTPQLQQAIKLLQLSNLELTAYVEQALEQNPLLERDESADAINDPLNASESPGEGPSNDSAVAREDFSQAEEFEAEREDVFAQDASPFAPTLPLTDW